MSKDIALKDSPVSDTTLMKLIEDLEQCSSSRDNCQDCPLLVDCRKAFDALATKKTHYHLSESEYQEFKRIFNKLAVQMSF